MKIVAFVSRLLLGVIFFVFGLNGFLHFIPMPPPAGLAGEWMGAMARSSFLSLVFAIQLVAGVLLLLGRFVPLALILLAPVIVNIVQFHLLLAPQGLGLAFLVVVLWFVVFSRHYRLFAPLLASR